MLTTSSSPKRPRTIGWTADDRCEVAERGTPSDRRRIGGDVFLATFPAAASSGAPGSDAPQRRRIETGFAVADWKARREADAYRSAFPGTAIGIEGDWFEIVAVATSAGAPRRTYYDLLPWDDANVIRTAFELTPGACQALTRHYREQQQRRRQGAALSYLPVLIGLLPAADQKRLESTFGVSPIRSTLLSAMALLFLSTLAIMAAFAYGRGMHFGELHGLVGKIVRFSPIAWYLLVESLLRLGSLTQNEPMGSLPVVLSVQVAQALRGAATSDRSASSGPTALEARHDTLIARDTVRPIGGPSAGSQRVDGPPHRIEVISRLPKDHWTANVTGIEIDGVAYTLVERGVVDTDRGPRHRFLLQLPEHEVLFKSYVRYRPEEVRDIYRAERRTRTAMWVETFPFIWALVDPLLQNRLAKVYDYDAEKWTRRTTYFEAALGAYFILSSLGSMLGGAGAARDGIALLGGGFLLWEAALRHSKLSAGELRGSLAGIPFQPLARWLLRWE